MIRAANVRLGDTPDGLHLWFCHTRSGKPPLGEQVLLKLSLKHAELRSNRQNALNAKFSCLIWITSKQWFGFKENKETNIWYRKEKIKGTHEPPKYLGSINYFPAGSGFKVCCHGYILIQLWRAGNQSKSSMPSPPCGESRAPERLLNVSGQKLFRVKAFVHQLSSHTLF